MEFLVALCVAYFLYKLFKWVKYSGQLVSREKAKDYQEEESNSVSKEFASVKMAQSFEQAVEHNSSSSDSGLINELDRSSLKNGIPLVSEFSPTGTH